MQKGDKLTPELNRDHIMGKWHTLKAWYLGNESKLNRNAKWDKLTPQLFKNCF